MSLRINHNIASLNGHRNMVKNDANISKSLEKLSSGLKINRAADNAAGLIISEQMRAQISGLNKAIENAETGVSMIQTAEGAMDEISSLLVKARELAIHAANGATDTTQRTADATELTEIKASIDRIAGNTKFGAMALLDGSATAGALTFQIGANNGDTAQKTGGIANLYSSAGGLEIATAVFTTRATSSAAISAIDLAITEVATERGKLGAFQADTLETTISSLRVSVENMTAAESTVRDVDFAAESANFTKNNIMIQASTAMLAQANQLPQNVLQLLQ